MKQIPPHSHTPHRRRGLHMHMSLVPSAIGDTARNGLLQPIVDWLREGGHIDALAKNGNGLLHMAVVGGQLRVAKELLQRGASVDLRDVNDNIALMMAAMEGPYAMVRLLLEHKASVDLQNTGGATALMQAAYGGHMECVQELLGAGASTELRNQDGYTALQVAEINGHATTAELLRSTARRRAARPFSTPLRRGRTAHARVFTEFDLRRRAQRFAAADCRLAT